MGTIIGSYHIATAALQQDQLALDATGENISNQNTSGYARRAVTWASGDTVSLSGAVPLQAPVATVTAQRSSVLDTAVTTATSNASAAATMKSAMGNLQAVFAIGSSGNEGSGINAAMSGFLSAMQAIAADPTSTSARQSALAAAQTVATSFQNTSANLSQQSADLDSTIQNSVQSVNQLSATIAKLNGQIARAGSTADRDALVDQRTAQIDSLSQFVGLQQTANSDGTVSLYTTSGGTLVVGTMSNPVSTGTASGTLQLYVQGKDITGGLQGGSIGGALAARDGALTDAQTNLDSLAVAFATAVNTANANGTTAAGTPGQPVFSIDASDPHAASGLAVTATSGTDFAAASSGEGSDGTGNANAMAALQRQRDASGNTFADTLSAAISSIGIAAAAANTAVTMTASAQTQAASNQENLSGVSLDTEAANLTQYQRSYEAEAKLLSILNQIMVDTINLGTPTAVS